MVQNFQQISNHFSIFIIHAIVVLLVNMKIEKMGISTVCKGIESRSICCGQDSRDNWDKG